MKIILLRHAETHSNKANKADSQIDSGLSEKGLEESRIIADKLKDYHIDLFVVSPLKRNLETIQPYLDTIKNPRLVQNALTLERDLGDFTGSAMGTFQKYCDENGYDKVFHKPKNGESIADTNKRAKQFLSYLQNQFAECKTVLICGHKNFLLCLEILLRGQDIKEYYKNKALSNSEIRAIDI